ncbi:MAG: iron chaperone [Stenotrophomonas sp.]|uniref:iron chaperone n=1 Tax=Stenotrophomonas sp. TaxID=69392 RepID=UPI003D6CC8A2
MPKSDGFTADERAAMKERARELKAEAKAGKLKVEGEADIMDKIGQMPPAEGKMARRLHEIITTTAPALSPKTWYGMPAYANADGKVVVFFQGASKFGARYSTLGFNDTATLDEGDMWPTVFALVTLTPEVEKKVTALVKKAIR